MKIRIKGNMVRFRLSKSEVTYFAQAGFLEEKTEFGKNIFSYALRTSETVENLSAEFVDGTITMNLPAESAKEWTDTDKIGYANEIDIGNGKKLFVLLEKDYKCLDTIEEDQSDNYENPLGRKTMESNS